MDGLLIASETPEAVVERMASDLSAYLTELYKSQEHFTIALSGGVTPKALFARLRQEPYSSAMKWEKWRVFWGDERCVPKEHLESNYKMAEDALLSFVPIPRDHIYRMRGEDPPPDAARSYEKTMREVFGASPEWPTFDLVLMGLGLDGHTASLFPGTSALEEKKRWVTENVVRSLQTVRLTLTIPVFNHAKQIWFMVTGSKKSGILAAVREDNSPLPASMLRPVDGELRWYVDKAAAGSIKNPDDALR